MWKLFELRNGDTVHRLCEYETFIENEHRFGTFDSFSCRPMLLWRVGASGPFWTFRRKTRGTAPDFNASLAVCGPMPDDAPRTNRGRFCVGPIREMLVDGVRFRVTEDGSLYLDADPPEIDEHTRWREMVDEWVSRGFESRAAALSRAWAMAVDPYRATA